MSQRTYLRLPIDANEGFPQSFQLRLNGLPDLYEVTLYVNALEREPDWPQDHVFELPDEAYMVMRLARRTAEGSQVIFRRKVVCNLEYEVAELAFVFRAMRVARRNLNGSGAFGSLVIGGVAAR